MAARTPGYVFDDLGEAVRKCYINFGVEITINVETIAPVPDAKTGRSTLHYGIRPRIPILP